MSLKVKKNNVSQTINLKEAFGLDFTGKRTLKELVGQEIIDHILKRTKQNKGVNIKEDGSGRTINLRKPYSNSYKNSLEFKAAGKQPNNVNMRLTGQMLETLDIKNIKGNNLTIGWTDKTENNKAHGHMTGKEGKVPKMKRPFFGVTNKELKDIGAKFKKDFDRALKIKQDEGTQAFNTFVLKLIDDLEDADGTGN